jgi:hypothetical protein
LILQRFSTALRKQDWWTVTIELFIVVLGVFLGLQVNNWNEARSNRALEREYLERLYSDFQETQDAKERRAGWDHARLTQQALVLDALRTGKLEDADREAFNTGLAYFGFGSSFDIQWSTVEELRSTGGMNLISDVELRSRILRFDAELERRMGISDNFLGSIYDHRQQLSSRYGVINFAGERDKVQLVYDFDELAADPAVVNLLSQIDFLSRFRRDLINTTLTELAELKQEIAKRLEPERGETP